ncbi:hypothetical protein BJ741DRAFT_608965 [Chytriomyces cf. hyalinus JEL632]|nr:hypothetical protein BJ741DRAFT_608965 [Chytriomyces cf. hyalinus JEL632]
MTSFSSKSILVTPWNDKQMDFYRQEKPAVCLDKALLLDATVPKQDKLVHLEQVMWTQFEHPDQAVSYNLETQDTWLRYHLRMVQLNESIPFDLDVISKRVGIEGKSRGGDLVLALTMARKVDEEVCKHLSHICFKLWRIGSIRQASPDESMLAHDIRAYARMTGLSHLKHAVALVPF